MTNEAKMTTAQALDALSSLWFNHESIDPNDPILPKALAALAVLRTAVEDYERVKANLEVELKRSAAYAEDVRKADAELERVRPLIEAVEKADLDELGCDSTCAEAGDLMTLSDDSKDILAAALALKSTSREKEGEK